jgi:outer membrane protein, multidrug efflux system
MGKALLVGNFVFSPATAFKSAPPRPLGEGRGEGTWGLGAKAGTSRIAVLLLLPALLWMPSGCAVGPDYHRAAAETPAAWKEAPPSGWKEATPQDELAKGNWWEIFGDPVLNDLEKKATAANQSLKAAMARVNQARAIARIAEADFFPGIDLNPSAIRSRQSGNRAVQPGSVPALAYTANTFSIPFDLSYELDIWGKVRRSFEAASADAQGSVAAYETILLTLKSSVAQTYFNLRYLDADLLILKNNSEVLKKSLDLVLVRYRGGIANGLDVSQAETLWASTQAQYVGEKKQRAEQEHALAVLLGRPASEFSLAENPLSQLPPVIPPGLPSELLERRPDVAQAERAMAASNARIGVSKSAFFPSLSLTGSAGLQSDTLSRLLRAESFTWSFGPGILQPIFEGGRLKADLKRARAAYDESVANYRQQVLVAFQEVEDALADLRILADQGEAQARAVEASTRAREISAFRYKEGAALYLEVLDAQRTVLQNEQLAAQILGMRFLASVQLIKAIGGGWEAMRPA